MRLPWLVVAFVLSFILSILQFFAVENYLYWRFVWFDVPMHFLGGASIAVFLIALSLHFRPRLFLLGTVIAFIGWEVFEYLAGFPRETNFVFDTALDLLMDTLGATLAYVIARKTIWHLK